MKAYDTQVDSIGQSGYLAARMVVAALLKIDPAKIDRAAATEAIQSIQDFKNDMLCAPWSFGPKDATARLGNRAGWIAQMTDNKWKVNTGCVAVDEDLISK
jgi:branched-chain amino acid transport system substrate-binding protein